MGNPDEFLKQAHLGGKRYKREKAKLAADKFDFEQFAPDIVQSKKDPRKLFCHLTKTTLNKVPEEVKLHVNGRRFKLRKQEREELDARRAERKKKQGGGEEEDPVLEKFKSFDVDSGEEDDEDGEDSEESENDIDDDGQDAPKMKGRLMPAIGKVVDDDNEDFEEVQAAPSEDDESDDGEDEGRAGQKEKLPWPIPEFSAFGAGKKRKPEGGGGHKEKRARVGQDEGGQAQAGEGGASSGESKHHGRGDKGAASAANRSKHHGRGDKANAKGASVVGEKGGGARARAQPTQGRNGLKTGRT